MAMIGVGSAVTVDVVVSVGAKVGRGVRVTTGVFVKVKAGTPTGAVVPSMVGMVDAACVGAINVMVAVTGAGVERPVRSIAHVPNPVSEIITEIRMMLINPVNEIPDGEVG